MKYLTLTARDLDDLAHARVRALEADHYHWELRLAECVQLAEATEIRGKLDDLARRIAVHLPAAADEPTGSGGTLTELPDGSTAADGDAAGKAYQAVAPDPLTQQRDAGSEPTTTPEPAPR